VGDDAHYLFLFRPSLAVVAAEQCGVLRPLRRVGVGVMGTEHATPTRRDLSDTSWPMGACAECNAIDVALYGGRSGAVDACECCYWEHAYEKAYAEVDRLTAEVDTLRAQLDKVRGEREPERSYQRAYSSEVRDALVEVNAHLHAQLDKVRAAIAPECLECLTGEHEALTAHEVYRR
jgi:hypothetical protein